MPKSRIVLFPRTHKSRDQFGIAKRWSPKLAAEENWTPIVNRFLTHYHRLDMNSSEAMVMIHLVSHKWTADHPFPAVATIAERMGVTENAVRNNVRSLEKKGLLKREYQTGTVNRFDLTPLIRVLELEEDELTAYLASKQKRKEVKP